VEDILALARKVAEEAEVYVARTDETPVHFEANRLKHIQSKQTTIVALRIIRNGRIGYATSTRVEDRRSLVDDAVATAEFGQKAEFQFPTTTRFPTVKVYDPAVGKVSLDQMTNLGREMIAALTNYQPEILCEGGVTKAIYEVTIANTRGGHASYRQSEFGLGMEGQLTRGTDMLFVGEQTNSCHPVLDTRKIIRTTTRQLRLAKRQATVSTGQMPVIFTQDGVAGALVLPLMSAFNGKTVLEGASPIGGKLGELVFDTALTLWDDATLAYRPGSRPCDDEGVPSRKTVLIEDGVVRNFVYDLQTAAKAGKESTGNGHRGAGLPAPGINAFVFQNGTTSFAEMVKDIKNGLIVEQMLGAGQGNTLGGDFSGNVLLGFKIENGKIAGRVKDTMVSGNIYQLLKNIEAVGSDGKWVGGSLRCPSLYLRDVSVASR
jgi:PmbA protein